MRKQFQMLFMYCAFVKFLLHKKYVRQKYASIKKEINNKPEFFCIVLIKIQRHPIKQNFSNEVQRDYYDFQIAYILLLVQVFKNLSIKCMKGT